MPSTPLASLYRSSLALATDLYQLTMAYAYWKSGVADREVVFHLTFRREPFGGAFAVAAGTALAVEYLHGLRFDASDCDYLATLTGADGKPLFERGFLDALAALRFTGSVDVVPEGAAVFAHEPLIRVRAPALVAQLVETPLLTLVNFSTLIATKAARVCDAAAGEPVLEFGLRRAQGFDGGLTASRAAWIGGVAGTSNVLAGKLYGLPVRGTHAHSWVMFWGDDERAFREYAAALPSNCTFLCDTFDTLDGVRAAVAVGRELRDHGHDLLGIRLDSGDLAHLSIESRRILDEAGFTATRIVASNDLDETLITNLQQQGARIDSWGVGTKLVTAYDQPALGGVYKLGAVREPDGTWRYPIKLSEQPIKISTPGIAGVRRVWRGGELAGDVIYDAFTDPPLPLTAHDLVDPTRRYTIAGDRVEELLVPAIVDGALTGAPGTDGDLGGSGSLRARPGRAVAAHPPHLEPAAVPGRPRAGPPRPQAGADRGGARQGDAMTPIVFSSSRYQALGAQMAALIGCPCGVVERTAFPDGEKYQRIATEIADQDVMIVGGTIGEDDTLEIYDLASTVVRAGAYRLTLVIPYFGYSTMERAVKPGEVVTAKTRARLLSSIPEASRGNRVFLLDLHVGTIAHYFEGAIRTVHVYGKPIVMAAARRLGGDAFVLACTDAGRAKWVESLANDLGVPAAFVYKRRLDGEHTEVTGVSASVAGKRVVIYDDMIRTGGSLVNAARSYRDAGAVAIDAIATHGILPGDSIDRIRASGLFGRIVVTDSHPRAVELAPAHAGFLEVEPVAPLLVEHLRDNQ